MLKSLSAGVTGLQAHQIALNVVSNNIANVDTVGFKYSRANFSNLLSQVSQVATGPQNGLGGKNGISVGLGTTINATTQIFSEGSINTTDNPTDCAINGNGFFIVSGDGGNTLKYTRAGNFQFDADGNLVDTNGNIVQGWLQNQTTGKIDSSTSIQPIQISPGLTTPAQASSKITLQANLNSGNNVTNFSAISSLDRFPDAIDINDNGVLSTADGDVMPGTGFNENSTSNLYLDSNGNLIERGMNMGVMTDSTGTGFALQSGTAPNEGQGEDIGFRTASLTGTNAAHDGTSDTTDTTIAAGDITINGIAIPGVTLPAGNTSSENATLIANAINTKKSTTGVTATVDSTGHIQLTNDNSGNIKNIAVTLTGNGTDSGLTNGQSDSPMKEFRYTDGSTNAVGWNSSGTVYYFKTSEDMRQGMQELARNYLPQSTGRDDTSNTNALLANSNSIETNDTGAYVTVDSSGKFDVYNPGNDSTTSNNYDFNIGVYAISDANTTQNTTFNQTLQSLSGALPAGNANPASSQSFNIPTASSSIDIYDSLGSKHTVSLKFIKSESNATTGSTWDVQISVPSPGTISNVSPTNMIEGQVTFNTNGSLASFTPPSISFTANNGSSPNQNINLDVGTSNAFDGLTSFDSTSSTSGISQDGYTGGNLTGITVDSTGTLLGSFSNGKSFGLAQMALATFANDQGLSSTGGNVYTQSANSGNPVIGTASSGNRGAIESSSLESSNVDLSRSLTQLIVIQRGYQANAKTITTSDQILQTLLGLKQ
jgi:flagellar hook protein FlgE